MEAYVKYPMFHAEMKRKYVKNAFLPQNMYYNAERDFYVCPMGQHLERCGTRTSVSDLGYRSVLSVYRAVNCTGCPLRGECYKSKSDRRTIEVNHRVNSFKRQARELLTGERGLEVQPRLQAVPSQVEQESESRVRSRRTRTQPQEILGNALRQDCGSESGLCYCIGGLDCHMRQK